MGTERATESEDAANAGSSLGWRRLLLRAAIVLAALALVDLGVKQSLASQDYDEDWRMPRTMPTSQLEPFVRHIDEAGSGPDSFVISFLGASPTWGDAVSSAHQTVPARFDVRARRRSSTVRTFNLASNGQLLGDEYFLARRAARSSDLLFVQLTYHNFNKSWRGEASRRYPELSTMLGVPIDRNLARVLRCDETPRVDVTGAVERALRRNWRLYGQRDALAAKMFGRPPEVALFDRWQRATLPDYADMADQEEGVLQAASFDELLPDQQMAIIDDYATAVDFRVNTYDPEVAVLRRLAADLRSSGTPTVFYISPINVETLESFEVFDRAVYDDNIAVLRRVVEPYGHTFVDLNEKPLPSSVFADINHTTAEGCDLTAAALLEETSELVITK